MKQYRITPAEGALTVDIQIGESDHKFTFVKNGINYEYGIKGFRTDYKAKTVSVDYSVVATDSEGNILSSKPLSYTETTPARYLGLYSLNSFSEAAGDFYGKQCVNGVMERSIGFKAFGITGEILEGGEWLNPPDPLEIP